MQKAADQGNPDAQNFFGEIYTYGAGTKSIDWGKAIEFYRKAADQGNSDAQYALGKAYYYGDGLPKNPVEGLAWLYLANAQGEHQAICKVAEQTLSSDSINQSKLRANTLLKNISSSPSGKISDPSFP